MNNVKLLDSTKRGKAETFYPGTIVTIVPHDGYYRMVTDVGVINLHTGYECKNAKANTYEKVNGPITIEPA